MNEPQHQVAVIGGGIVGLATALALLRANRGPLVVLEAEDHLAAHQTGHNSNVIHSGLYYKPGSLKAQNCVAGRDAMYRFCAEHGIPHERCGKLVVATSEEELASLAELERRGKANGLEGLRRLAGAELREHEPHVNGIAGLFVPQTGIVDYRAVALRLGELIRDRGGEIRLDRRVIAVKREPGGITLDTNRDSVKARYLVNCAGLQSDRIARLCGLDPGVQIIPFRGEYYKLRPEREHLVRNLIYPVPDARFPFLGVHFTRMVRGGVEAGPNAVLALKREGYSRTSFSLRDTLAAMSFRGFWRMTARYWQTGFGELHRSLSKRAFVAALQRLIPELQPDDVIRHGAGVRAQAVDHSGSLVDDFRVLEVDRMVHVVNAPSPAATASLSIGDLIAARADRVFC
jgi:L-2-hydroxyglutarate oxidase